MARRSIYSSVSRPKKNNAKIAAIVLAVVCALLIVFIVWCAVMFSGDGVYGNKVRDISELKIQIEERDTQIAELKEQIARLEEQKKELEASAAAQKPEATVAPTPTATSSPNTAPPRTVTPKPVPTASAPAETSVPDKAPAENENGIE